MGGNSNKTTTKSKTTYGNTTTSNPYVQATTTNNGTTAGFQPGSALETVYNFVNGNISSMLDDYLNPNINSVTNQARLKAFTKNLNSSSRQSLENNIINPLSSRNMLRSSQATDLYRNLSNQQTASLEDYINDLLSTAQNESASMINNLLQMYMQGYSAISDVSDKSLHTSSGNATRTSESATTSDSDLNRMITKLLGEYLKLKSGGVV